MIYGVVVIKNSGNDIDSINLVDFNSSEELEEGVKKMDKYSKLFLNNENENGEIKKIEIWEYDTNDGKSEKLLDNLTIRG